MASSVEEIEESGGNSLFLLYLALVIKKRLFFTYEKRVQTFSCSLQSPGKIHQVTFLIH